AEWKGPGASPIKIAVISDLHLGRFVGPGHLKRVADLVNSRSPDIVLIAGDTIDDAGFLKNKRRKEMTASIFESLKPRLGVWAVPGNHDYYAGIEDSVSFLQSCDVKVLSDEWAAPGWEMLLIGRDDPAGGRYGRERTSLRSIISNAKTTLGPAAEHLPIVVLDHQPHNLEESRSEGVALQISGHTHRGQLFPVNFIVAWLFEKHYGPYKKGDTNYYISSGAGTWGPPIRTIGRPEVVFVSLYAR
ncbi:MAG: metallophosphoesterase, partial [Synergistaceae bacterium]|nr:metallophosphoesterase [Synergistaceae bacterium]